MAIIDMDFASSGSSENLKTIIPYNYDLVGGENVAKIIATHSGSMGTETITCTEDYNSYDYIIIEFAKHTSYTSNRAEMIIPMGEFLSGKTFSITTNYGGGNYTRSFNSENKQNTITFTTNSSSTYTNIPLAVYVV